MSRHETGPEGKLLQAWALATQKPLRGDQLRLSSVEGAFRTVNATVSSRGDRGLLIPLRSGERIQVQRALRPGVAAALRAERSQFSSNKNVVDALHVWCVDRLCDDAFTSFATMLIGRISDVEIGSALEACYLEFVKLVGRDEHEITVTGLLGELMVLRDLVERQPAAVGYWAGPRGERHDFRHAVVSVEVKTSRRSESKTRRIHISDWDQLEVPDGGRLFLHFIRLERVAGGDLTIRLLIAFIRSNLDAVQSALFDESLANFNPQLLMSEEAYSEISRETFAVLSGFPRIVPSSVAQDANLKGISAVQFDLDLQQATSFAVPWMDAIDAIEVGS